MSVTHVGFSGNQEGTSTYYLIMHPRLKEAESDQESDHQPHPEREAQSSPCIGECRACDARLRAG